MMSVTRLAWDTQYVGIRLSALWAEAVLRQQAGRPPRDTRVALLRGRLHRIAAEVRELRRRAQDLNIGGEQMQSIENLESTMGKVRAILDRLDER